MTGTLRMPITTASRKGISALTHSAEQQRIALTNHGRIVAYVDSPNRAEADTRKIRGAAWEILQKAANLYSEHDLAEVSARLGFDLDELRAEVARKSPAL